MNTTAEAPAIQSTTSENLRHRHWLNQSLLSIGTLAPFLREAGKKQRRWQDAFWKKARTS